MEARKKRTARAAGVMAAALTLAAPAYGATYTWTDSAPHASEDFALKEGDTLTIQSGSHTVRHHLDGFKATVEMRDGATLNLSPTFYKLFVAGSERTVWFPILSQETQSLLERKGVWTEAELDKNLRWQDAQLLSSTLKVADGATATINGSLYLATNLLDEEAGASEPNAEIIVGSGATLKHSGFQYLAGHGSAGGGTGCAWIRMGDRSRYDVDHLWMEGGGHIIVKAGTRAALNIGTLYLDNLEATAVRNPAPGYGSNPYGNAPLQFGSLSSSGVFVASAGVDGHIGELVAAFNATRPFRVPGEVTGLEALSQVNGEADVYVAVGTGVEGHLFKDTKLDTNSEFLEFKEIKTGSVDALPGIPVVVGTLKRLAASQVVPGMDAGVASLLDGYGVDGSNPLLQTAFTAGSAVESARMVASAVSAGQAAGAAAHNLAVGWQGMSLIMARAAGRDDDTPSVSGLSGGDGFGGRLGVWATPVYVHERGRDIRMMGLDTGYRADSWGALIGADYSVGRVRAGMAASLGAGDAKSTGEVYRTRNEVDYGGISLYGSLNLEPIVLSASAGWLRTHNDVRQDNGAGTLESAFDSDLWNVRMQAEYGLRFGGVEVIPRVGVEYARYRQPGFSGKLASSTVARHAAADMDIVNLPVGVRVRSTLALAGGALIPELRLGVVPSVGDTRLAHRVTMPGSSGAAVLACSAVDRVTGEAGGGLSYTRGRASFGLDYDFQFSEHRQAHGVQAQLRYAF